jgi:Zn-dependent protease with chaperone function
MPFFNSFLGHYLAQTIVYSLLIVTVTETLMPVWRISEPLAQIKFRFLALLLPLLCPVLFQLLYPPRNDLYFRELIALIDLNTWLAMGGGIAVWHFFAAIMLITAGVFLVKEALPMVKHHMMRQPSLPVIGKGQFPRLDAALSRLPATAVRPLPPELLSPEDMPMACISGHTLVISASMIDLLDDDELQAIIGHEIAHLSKTVRWINRVLLLLRWLQFYNPLALLIFRRITVDTEKLCDEIAIRLSGKRLSLTSGLLKIFQNATGDACQKGQGRRHLRLRVNELENVANWDLVKERIKRLVHGSGTAGVPYQNFRLAITGLMLAALLFFIV